MNVADLNLLVRALHQDVSALDQRLRELELIVTELRQLRHAELSERLDLRVRDARPA